MTIPTPIALADDFGFTDDHDLLRKTARRWLADNSPLTAARNLVDDATGYEPDKWRQIVELGWPGLVIAETHGGAELDYLSLALLLEETGRCLLPSPLVATVLAGIAVDLAGNDDQRKHWCTAIAQGDLIATVGLSEPSNSWELDGIEATATADGSDYVLSGTKTHVMWATSADVMVAPFRVDAELALFAVDLKDTQVSAEVSIDTTRRTGRVVLDNVRVPADRRLGSGHVAELWSRGQILLAAEMVGAADEMLIRTRDYANERKQFNRQISSFQAVKHPIVNVMLAVENARSLSTVAAATLDAEPSRVGVAARMAKAAANDALAFAADRGVQFHGGYGFTWDCDAHFYFKRSLWCNATLGDSRHHRRHLAKLLLD